MNSLIILPAECVDQEHAILLDKRAEYGFETHGLRPGQTVKCAIFGERRCMATILSATKTRIEVQLKECESAEEASSLCESGSHFHLIIGLSRPQTIKKVLQGATILGAGSVHFVSSERGEKSYLQSTALEPDQIQYELIKGLEQVWEPHPPAIKVHRDFGYFEREHLATLAHATTLKLVAHPGGVELAELCTSIQREQEESLHGATLHNGRAYSEIVMAIGPEKGWSEPEVHLLTERGFHQIGLGQRVMRVELALVFLCGQLHALKL